MVIRFDSLDRFETPVLTLCNPGSQYDRTTGLLTRAIGALTNTTDLEVLYNFNSSSELNVRVVRPSKDEEQYSYLLNIYNAVQNRRLLFVKDIGYFAISNVVSGREDDFAFKDVSAKSIDIELEQRMVPYIPDGTYRFTSDQETGTTGLLETLVATLPLWTIGEVDEDVAELYRTFEDVSVEENCLSFMLNEVQDAYDCIFIFDIFSRTINVYSQDNYVVLTDVHITNNDLINSLEVNEDANNLYTAINVTGTDDVTISAINPTGTNVIYDFSYYIDWMPSSLGQKVAQWQTAVENAKNSYYNLNLSYYQLLASASDLNSEIERINTQITMYSRCRDNIVASSSVDIVEEYNEVIVENGGEEIDISGSIDDTLFEISSLIADCEADLAAAEASLATVNADIVQARASIEAVHAELAIDEYFTSAELEELSNYVFEGSYSDEYVVITDNMDYTAQFEQMKTLYDRAAERLSRVCVPTQEFTVDVENFIFDKDFAEWTAQLETGCLINVELARDDVAALFLTNITVNYEDHALSMTFGNRFNRFDTKSLFDKVLGNVQRSANTLNYVKEILYPIKSGQLNAMQQTLQNSRNITMGAAFSTTDEEVIIDGSGYTGRRSNGDGTYDPHQIKINGRNIVFTDDAWESCKVAIGDIILDNDTSVYGVNAEVLIGELIMGGELHILDSNGTDLLTVIDNSASEAAENAKNAAVTISREEISAVASELQDGIEATRTEISVTADGLSVAVGDINKLNGAYAHFSYTNDSFKIMGTTGASDDQYVEIAADHQDFVQEGAVAMRLSGDGIQTQGVVSAESGVVAPSVEITPWKWYVDSHGLLTLGRTS